MTPVHIHLPSGVAMQRGGRDARRRRVQGRKMTFDHIALRKAVTRELRRQRRVAGLTQAQMAVYLDTHRPIISRLERLSSPHTPSLETVACWAAVTGHSLLDVARAIDAAMGATPPDQPYSDRSEHGDRSSSCRSNRRSPSTAQKAARARAAR